MDQIMCGCGSFHPRILLLDIHSLIDKKNVICYKGKKNLAVEGIFKPFEYRAVSTNPISSNVSGDLFFIIPFRPYVRLRGMHVHGGPDLPGPRYVKVYKNKPEMIKYTSKEIPDQIFELKYDGVVSHEYLFRPETFGDIHTISLYFPAISHVYKKFQINYIGFAGIHYNMPMSAAPVTLHPLEGMSIQDLEAPESLLNNENK